MTFTCDICGDAFSRKDNLIRHVNSVHHKTETLTCKFCNKELTRTDHLYAHQKKSGPRQNYCDFCDISIDESLTEHIRTRHEDQKYLKKS